MAVPVTLKGLAELLHLSPSTVSRALKGHPDISKSTQERVRNLAEQLNYQPDILARSLRKKKACTLAVLIPRLDGFYSRVVSEMADLAWQREYKVAVFESREDEEREKKICHFLEKSGIGGLLAAPAVTTRQVCHYRTLLSAGIPIVVFERILGSLDSDRVVGDHFKGVCEAVGHMIDGGCRRVAYLGGPNYQIWFQKRQMGYVQALREHHLPIDTKLILEYDPRQLEQVVRRWIEQFGVDGIFAVEDEVALSVMKILEAMRCRIPEDIALCGYGNCPMAEYTCPTLTSVDESAELVARNGLELLWKRAEEGVSGHAETRFLKNHLIVRGSTRKVRIG